MKQHNKGFTLIEVVVTMAIVAILAMIAIPSYQSYLIKGNRAAAQSFLMDVDSRQKQYLLDVRSYASSLADLSLAAPNEVDQYYTISFTGITSAPPAYTVVATPKSDTRQASDGVLTLNSAGAKTHGSESSW